MTAPAPAKACEHCKTKMDTRRVVTGIPGTQPVDLSLCHCDYLPCPTCKEPVRDPKSRRCGSCNSQV